MPHVGAVHPPPTHRGEEESGEGRRSGERLCEKDGDYVGQKDKDEGDSHGREVKLIVFI